MAMMVGLPLGVYMIFNLFAPAGVMQNNKASAGAYAHYVNSFMYKQKTPIVIYRPEIAYKEYHSSLF
jgi:hypothetical protein